MVDLLRLKTRSKEVSELEGPVVGKLSLIWPKPVSRGQLALKRGSLIEAILDMDLGPWVIFLSPFKQMVLHTIGLGQSI